METKLVGLDLFKELDKCNNKESNSIKSRIRCILIREYLEDTKDKISLRESVNKVY